MTKAYVLKQVIEQNVPEGELPWKVLGRISWKSGVFWAKIREDVEISEEELEKSIAAAEELLSIDIGLKFKIAWSKK